MRIEIDLTDEELKALLLQEFGFDERVMEVNDLSYDSWNKTLGLVITNRPPAPAAAVAAPPQGEDVSFAPPAVEPARVRGAYYPKPEEGIDWAKAGPSQLCSCNRYWTYEKLGWVDPEGRLHRKDVCEPPVDEPELQPISDAAALSASRTGEHGTIDADDDIPF